MVVITAMTSVEDDTGELLGNVVPVCGRVVLGCEFDGDGCDGDDLALVETGLVNTGLVAGILSEKC